jgi:hypothetical protein
MADTGRTVFADGLWADGLWAVGFWATDDAPPTPTPTPDPPSGGWWPEFDHVRHKREKRRKELEAQAREQESIADEQAREIARLMRVQEEKDAERADLERLQRLADRYATRVPDLPKPVRLAILNAQDARTKNSLEQMRRMVEQMEDEEILLAVQQVLLLITD